MVDGVYNSELMAPYDIFHHTIFHTQHGMRVFTIAPTDRSITSFEGLQITAHYTYETSPPIDILVVPSAEHSMDSDIEDADLIGFVDRAGREACYVVSLCDGAFVLAKAGLLDGRACTTFPGDVDKFRRMFPDLEVHEELSFVHDGPVITSVGGARSYDPALYLVELIYGRKAAEGVGRGMVISWDLTGLKYLVIE